ncbi:MAG: imidazole glycerol phosphate synthase subunit HisH [Methanobacterium sp.]|nr:imidazole glycerol phosphate synthase subunit HisH [Methanobacterium sp.]
MIAIIDYGSGNLKSIKNGFSKICTEAVISSSIKELNDADALVLPGVGAFGNAIENLKGYENSIYNHIDDGKPFLGICLGLQILFTSSEESPGISGLDIFKGKVLKFPNSIKTHGFKIPHMGWNQLNISDNCPILNGVGNDFMYFVHSYYVDPDDKKIITATVDYGIDVPAVVCLENIFATQFHPEKSGNNGLRILKNFVELIQ